MRVTSLLFLVCLTVVAEAKTEGTKGKETSRPNPNPFMGSLAFTAQTPFDPIEGSDPLAVMQGGLIYRTSSDTGFRFNTRYFYSMVGHVNDDTMQGFSDSIFTYFNGVRMDGTGRPFAKDWGFGYSAGGSLPSSDNSQKAGMKFGLIGSALLSYVYKKATFVFINGLTYNSFEWDTADPTGYQYNEDLLFTNTLSARLALNSQRTWSTGIAFTYGTFRNTLMNIDNSYIIVTDVTGVWSRNIMTNLVIGGADRKTDTTNLFLYDRMFVLFGLTVMI